MPENTQTSREIRLRPATDNLAVRAGVTEDSVAMVEAEIRNGELYVTVAGEKNLQETTHRLPPELQSESIEE